MLNNERGKLIMNMQALMRQAQQMQKDITKKKDELNKKTFVGTSELVEVTFTGDKKLVSTKIKSDIDNDDKEIIEDIFVSNMPTNLTRM